MSYYKKPSRGRENLEITPSPQQYTDHARQRQGSRSISPEEIEMVLAYGRTVHTRNTVIHFVGRKEIQENGRELECCSGVHVLCSPETGVIITTYRNNKKSFKH